MKRKSKTKIKDTAKRTPEGLIDWGDRKCALCQNTVPVGRRMNRHHLSYANDLWVKLCYICHSVVHGRLKFHNPFEKKYGKDYGAYYMAQAIMFLYAPVINEILARVMGYTGDVKMYTPKEITMTEPKGVIYDEPNSTMEDITKHGKV